MNHITLDIKDVVKHNLNQKRENILKEAISFENGLDNEIIQEHIKKGIQLIYDGYSIDEIAIYLSNASQSLKEDTGNDFDFGGMFKDSMLSMAKEFGIKWLLDYIGFNPTLSTIIAQGAADLSLRDLILPFKNKEYCDKHLPNLLDAILEVAVRQLANKYLWEKLPGQKGSKNRYEWIDLFTTVPAGNITGELIRKTKTSEGFAKIICPIIHK